MRRKINWGILLLSAFLILIMSDWKNLKYLSNLIKEFGKIFKKHSQYIEDGDYILIHKKEL